MSMVGTFDGFTAARLGLYAAQHGLRVTGNNVSNINTPGYTRQRVDQVSFKSGANDIYRSHYDNHVGSGALVTGISQLRDPYLDIRFRNASTNTYHYDTWLSGLQNIASILDEVGKGDNEDGLIYKAIQDLAEKLRSYSADPNTLNDRLVRNSATSLTLLFHNAADRLERLYNETVNEFNENISAVNEILTNIRDLNKSIRDAEIHGDTALEMRDERNRQIDALSQYMDIKVEYSFENVGGGIQVEKLTVKLNNANPDNTVSSDESILVDGVFATELSIPEERPILNTYGDAYQYLNHYTYLKQISGEDVDQFLQEYAELNKTELTTDDLLQLTDEEGNPVLDEDGNPVYLIGTNDSDVDGIYTEANDNFSIHLGKLLNAKGEEWKSSTTAWVEVDRATVIANARFSYTIGTTLSAAGQSFVIADTDGTSYTYIVDGTDDPDNNVIGVPLEIAADSEQFAAFLAKEFGKYEKYAGYNITSEGDQIIFQADPDADPAPEDLPNLYVSDEAGTGWVTVGSRSIIPSETFDEHGNMTRYQNYVQVDGRWNEVTVGSQYTHEVTLDDNDLQGILQAQRELLTEEGEFASTKDVVIDESALTKRGIPYYMKSLDLLAQKFAEAYNQLNTGYAYNQDGYYIDQDGNPLMLEELVLDENGGPTYDEEGNFIYTLQPVSTDGPTDGQLAALAAGGETLASWLEKTGYSMGGELFTTIDGTTTEGITAANISVSHGWSNGLWALVPTFKMLFADDEGGGLTHSTQNDNADHMVAMIDNPLTYNPRDLFGSDAIGPVLFSGSFNDMLSNMMAVEGEDASITGTRLTTAVTSLNEVDYSREGVSGVDLNDEAMNMITYQKAMTAAMRVMTAIDEVLDRLINNTGIAGR